LRLTLLLSYFALASPAIAAIMYGALTGAAYYVALGTGRLPYVAFPWYLWAVFALWILAPLVVGIFFFREVRKQHKVAPSCVLSAVASFVALVLILGAHVVVAFAFGDSL